MILKGVLKKTSLAIIDQGVSSLGSFLVAMLLARFMNLEEFGFFVLAYTTLMIIYGLYNSLIFNPLTVFSPALEEEEFSTYWSTTAIFHLILSGMLLLAMIVVVALLYLFDAPAKMLQAFTGLAIYYFFFLTQQYVRSLMIARQKYGEALLCDLLFSLFRIAGILMLHWMAWLNLLSAFLALTLAAFISILTIALRPTLKWKREAGQPRKVWSRHWNYGKWILLATIAFTVKVQLNPFIVAGILSIEATAALGACQQIANILTPLLMGVQNMVTPTAVKKLNRDGPESFLRWFIRFVVLSGSVVMAGFVFLSFMAGDIIDIVYAGKYNDFTLVASLLFLFCGFSYIDRQGQVGLQVLQQPRYISLLLTIAATVAVPTSVFCAYRWGVLGVAGGNLANIAMTSILCWPLFTLAFRKYNKLLEKKRSHI